MTKEASQMANGKLKMRNENDPVATARGSDTLHAWFVTEFHS